MKWFKPLCFILALFTQQLTFSQILDPIEWQYSGKHLENQEVALEFTAVLEPKWALYSQFIDEGGPVPTTFYFDESDDYELMGVAEEESEHVKRGIDPLFDGLEVIKFYDKAVFTQKVKLTSFPTTITGEVEFMTCDDERCLPPTTEAFEFTITENDIQAQSPQEEQSNDGVSTDDASSQLYGMSPEDLNEIESTCVTSNNSLASEQETSSIWKIFGLGFIGGLLALLTPCVFPMIPLTVSYFTKQSAKGNRSKGIFNAILYGVFILAVYLLLSVPFHLLDSINPDILNEISTSVVLNIIFFVVFIVFAFSFFGYYELTLPSSWTSVSTKNETIGGLIGIFFMALTLALVSFSCTGPILGSLLAGSLTSDGGAWQLTSGMAGFGLALGLPFALFAMFPNWLNSLPKSGGWLTTVKVVLGFLELALAFKFLSNADLPNHWRILTIEVFLVIWIIIFAGLSLYLFGKIKFPHDGIVKKLSVGRIFFAIMATLFTIYLTTGFRFNKETNTYYPLELLSGLAPPVGYSLFHPNDCPNDLICFKDLKAGLEYAQNEDRPIMLDFTGYACPNCRKMEEQVWSDEQVDELLRTNYVIISLYVDDKQKLSSEEQVNVARAGGGVRKLETVGSKWANFQTQFFQTNSQPYYVLLSPDGKNVLTPPVGYSASISDYIDFLNCGLTSLPSIE